MPRIRLTVAYDGTDYCGWQKQKDHAHGPKLPSLQGTIEQALGRILGHPIDLCASGRTDAGVHAYAQVAHFDTSHRRWPRDWTWALKSQLPPSIVVKEAFEAPETFHSTLSAVAKTYRYYIWNAERPSCFLGRYSWWIRRSLDLEVLEQLSAPLLGFHDFKSFQSQGTPVLHTRRKLFKIQWVRKTGSLIYMDITGNGFLKQMVRNIVGTLIEFYLRGLGPEEIERVLLAQDRTKAGQAAPPQGLFLRQVFYPKELDKLCVKL
ncbi:MAG: tRNA pseudouridine(38-40) synthase TruA [Bdellovibrionaceae bacterium]|jgi:tRNA pseudouridine38-40 synthase|nr:tRNA pseudouridine(38-40) synthase TruA [Pseudobdellovibrionaceae bacterium]